MHFVNAMLYSMVLSLLMWLCHNLKTPTYAEQLAQAKVLQMEGYKEIVTRQQIADNRALAKTLLSGDIVRWNGQLWLVVNSGRYFWGPMLHTYGSYRELIIQDDETMKVLTEVIRCGSAGYNNALQRMTTEAVTRCSPVPVGPEKE